METKLKDYARTLRISDVADLHQEVEFEDRHQYLTELFRLAIEGRKTRKAERLIKRAGFPNTDTLQGYDFEPVNLPKGLDLDSLTDLQFIDDKENLLMVGAVGTGKTRLAVSLGMKACLRGMSVKFHRAADLCNTLLELHPAGKAGKLIRDISSADLFILDEVGYVPFSKSAAEMLFTVISNSYENQSIITTSNLEFGRWNEVFGDQRLTAALIDRLVHHAHIITFSGTSYRLRQALSRIDEEDALLGDATLTEN